MIERDEVYRVRTTRRAGTLSRLLEAIAAHGAQVGDIETIKVTHDHNIREITVIAPSDDVVGPITESIKGVAGVELIAEPVDRAFEHHRGGKLRVVPGVEVRTLQDMREVYTPGVARVSLAIQQDPSLAREFTWKQRSVAVVSDGSRVLGLGNIGPEACLPVIEGKALFYSMFADLNAVPIALGTQDPDEIVTAVRAISPGFGGIHLEDIASPGVYEIEARLDRLLDIPVMHDDQHGTAVVVLAAVLRAAEICGHDIADLTFGQIGLGAAGSAIAILATAFPFASVTAYDPVPAACDRLPPLAATTPLELRSGGAEHMEDVMRLADVVVMATGQARLIDPDSVREGQMILALTNPVPEIERHVALDAGAVLATDGSIVNNVLAYPGLFRGAMEGGAQAITAPMRVAAARTLAALAPGRELLPDPLDRTVHDRVAESVRNAVS